MHLIRRSILLPLVLAAGVACTPVPGPPATTADQAMVHHVADTSAPRPSEPEADELIDHQEPVDPAAATPEDPTSTAPEGEPFDGEPAAPVTTAPVTTTGATTTRPSTSTAPTTAAPEGGPPAPTFEAPNLISARSSPASDEAATADGHDDAVNAAQLTVLERGHVDLIEVTRDGDALRVQVKDDTGPSVAFRSPEQVQVRVGDGARTEVPDGPFGFLGAPGSPVYLLPQVQDPDLIWPGWSTERLTAGQVVGDAVRLRMVGVDGPGELALFTTDQFGSPTVLFDSDGEADQVSVPIRTHAHSNWAFSAAGVHRVTFEVAADLPGAGPRATRVTYVFLVGNAAAPVDPGTVAPPTVVDPDGDVQGGPGAPGTDRAASPTGGADTTGTARTGGASTGGSAVAGSGTGSLARTGGSADTMVLMGLGLVMSGLLVSGTAAVTVRRRPLRTVRG
jgi:surface-anchored protein